MEHCSIASFYNFFLIEIPTLFSFCLDFFVILKIACFYRQHSKTAIERHYLLNFLCYPVIFFLLIIPYMILIIFDFIVKINPNLEIRHQSFLINIEMIALYLSILKPLIIAGVYAI